MPGDYIPLCWGDIVRIHGISPSKNKPIQGLIISKGYFSSHS